MKSLLVNPVLSPGERGIAGGSNAADAKPLSDSEWVGAAHRIHGAVENYHELDMRALAEKAIEQYRMGRDFTGGASAVTTAMIERTEVRLSSSARAREFIKTYALFLAPLVAMLLLSFGGTEFVGWSRVSLFKLNVLYCVGLFLAIGIAALAFMSANNRPVKGLRRLYSYLPMLGAGAIAASLAAPILINSMRVNELSMLAQTSAAAQQLVASYLAKKSAGVPSADYFSWSSPGVAGLSITPTLVGTEYTFDAPGLPGELRAEIRGSSGEVYWKTLTGKEFLQSRIEVGKLEKALGGTFQLVKANHEIIGPITADPYVVLTGDSVAAILDSKGSKLLAVTPVPTKQPQ